MIKQIQNILYATNLSENCRDAFDMVASMATRFKATIVLLHVMEKMPEHLEGRLRRLFGEQEWAKITNAKEYDAWEALIAKKSTNKIIHEALKHFCTLEGIDDASCGYHSREIVISDGAVVDDIIETSEKYNCDLIVLGSGQGWVSHNAIGHTIKSTLRLSRIPVLVVPPAG